MNGESDGQYRRNHYVPQWFQKRFLPSDGGPAKFHYLDQQPDRVRRDDGGWYTRNHLLNWGTQRCFVEKDLYTTKFPGFESTEIEQFFFGEIDASGKAAVEYFDGFQHPSAKGDLFQAFLTFASTQKLRTPKGLKQVARYTRSPDKNRILFRLQEIHRMHCAIWSECEWCLVDASDSPTKFLLSDHPVTVYNSSCFPGSSTCRNGGDPDIWLNGTHTIVPLSLNRALVLTNLSWARNPWGNPVGERPHSKLFRPAMFKFTDIQTGRKLNEDEVRRINLIIKSRARRYIAAAQKDWLYPEAHLPRLRWDRISENHLLMPDPRSMNFSSEIIMGFKDGSSDAYDEYGRKPWHDDYRDSELHEYEWNAFHAFQGEYARLHGPKRRGVCYNLGKFEEDKIDDDDFHAYHLEMEARCKPAVKTRKRRK